MRASLLIFGLLIACGTPGSRGAEDAAPSQPEPLPVAPPVRPPEVRDLAAYTADLPGHGALFFRLQTTLGTIECQLFERQAPKAVANFVGLAGGKKPWLDPETQTLVVEQPYYDGVAFHRVVQGFVIQAGDRTGTGRGGPGYTFADEIGTDLRFDRPGVLAMANKGPNTNGSQFFITERAIPHLNKRHTIFGQCADIQVVRAISAAPTTNEERPESPPRIESVSFFRKEAP